MPSPAPPWERRRLLAAGGLAGGALALAGCSPTALLNALVPRGTYRSMEDIAYGPHVRQRLDVYLPDQPTTGAPIAVFFYGGSWTRGERSDYRFVGEALASAGVVTVVPDYRLSPAVDWTEILRDCAAASAWAAAHAPSLGASADRLHLVGHSAGGYNAAMLALDPRWLGLHGLQPSGLAGWAGIAGAYNFLPIRDPATQRAFNWPATPTDSQPMAHANGAAPPTLLVAAREDDTVDPVRNTVALARELKQAGTPVELLLLEGVSHVTVIAALAPPLRALAPVRAALLKFVLG